LGLLARPTTLGAKEGRHLYPRLGPPDVACVPFKGWRQKWSHGGFHGHLAKLADCLWAEQTFKQPGAALAGKAWVHLQRSLQVLHCALDVAEGKRPPRKNDADPGFGAR